MALRAARAARLITLMRTAIVWVGGGRVPRLLRTLTASSSSSAVVDVARGGGKYVPRRGTPHARWALGRTRGAQRACCAEAPAGSCTCVVRACARARTGEQATPTQQRPMRSLVTTAASARRALAAAATALALVVFIAPGALLPLRGAAALRLVPAGGHLHSLPAPRRRTELHAATLELRVDESSPPIAAPLGPSPIGFSMEYGPEVRASGRGLAGRSRRST